MDLYKFGVYLVFIVSSGPYSETLSKQTFFFSVLLSFYILSSFSNCKSKISEKNGIWENKTNKNPRTIETSSTLTPGDDCAQRLYVSLDLASVLI